MNILSNLFSYKYNYITWKVGRAVMQHLGKVSSATARGFDSLTFRHIKIARLKKTGKLNYILKLT